jgi:hypothetical protein
MMKSVKFETTVSENGRVVLADEAWREPGRRAFEEAYCAEDSVYDELVVAIDTPDR